MEVSTDIYIHIFFHENRTVLDPISYVVIYLIFDMVKTFGHYIDESYLSFGVWYMINCECWSVLIQSLICMYHM